MNYDEYYETNVTYMINNILIKIKHIHIIKFTYWVGTGADVVGAGLFELTALPFGFDSVAPDVVGAVLGCGASIKVWACYGRDGARFLREMTGGTKRAERGGRGLGVARGGIHDRDSAAGGH
jgi:hypothetical protein